MFIRVQSINDFNANPSSLSPIAESLDFHVPVKLGHVMTFTGRMVFTSNRSMEIEVFVDAEDVVKGK